MSIHIDYNTSFSSSSTPSSISSLSFFSVLSLDDQIRALREVREVIKSTKLQLDEIKQIVYNTGSRPSLVIEASCK